ncbi:MAG: PTS sugar transporter subunit IIA [Oscillospiraceae bacterium]|nr:PTS sugar transporter subunit IIA [Oscillospiraceae bacterium]
MVGVSLFCHGDMAEGMKDSVNLIMGEQEHFNVLGLYEGNDINKFKDDVYEAIVKTSDGEGVIVFVDLMGASPFNSVSANVTKLKENNIEIRLITGVNLPMLVETFMQRDVTNNLTELYTIAKEAGHDGIKELFEELGK